MINKTLKEIAEYLGLTYQGDPSCPITGIATLERAQAGDISFLSNPKYRKFLSTTKASAVIVSQEDLSYCKTGALITKNPRLSLALVMGLFEYKTKLKAGIHPSVVIGQDCRIHSSVSLGPNCVLGDSVTLGENVVLGPGVVVGDYCRIGKGSVVKANVTLYDNVVLGEGCLIHSGTVIGSDGFGFANEKGNWFKMPHIGGVSIGDQVEIGSNSSIDRGFLEDTRIDNGVIIDNLVQIGHNVVIGARTAIAGCVAIAGSTKIGQSCLIGGGASIAGHLEIADHVHITATSGVNRSLKPGVYSSGFPAKPSEVWRKNAARFQFLDEMAKRLKALERTVKDINH